MSPTALMAEFVTCRKGLPSASGWHHLGDIFQPVLEGGGEGGWGGWSLQSDIVVEQHEAGTLSVL